MLLLGTTFAGHDWNTGSMSNQLLFEPRRERVWLAKALAVGMLTGGHVRDGDRRPLEHLALNREIHLIAVRRPVIQVDSDDRRWAMNLGADGV